MSSGLYRTIAIGLLSSLPGMTIAQTPVLVKDINPGVWSGSVFVDKIVLVGSSVLFITSGGLWRYDGNGPSTLVRADLSGKYAIQSSISLPDGSLLFSGEGYAPSGNELWRTDGTAVGTHLLRDLNPGYESSIPSGFVRLSDGSVLFATPGAVSGVWRTDGSSAGTIHVADLTPRDGRMVAGGSRAFFAATAGGEYRLGVSDGTSGGTTLLASPADGEIGMLGDVALFGRLNGSARELWRSDGTDPGTTLVLGLGGSGALPSGFAVLGGNAYFAAGGWLWKTDGSSAGTVPVKAVSIGAGGIASAGSLLFFSASTPESGLELWRSDGAADGTYMVADLTPGSASSSPWKLTPTNDPTVPLLFLIGSTLWRTDGTAAGTVALALPAGFTSAGSFVVAGASVYLLSRPAPLRASLTLADPVAVPVPGMPIPNLSWPRGLAEVGGRVVFSAYRSDIGDAAYSSDGSGDGTTPLAGVTGGFNNPIQVQRLGTLGLFSTDQGALYRTDGLSAEPVVDAAVGLRVTSRLPVVGGRLFFGGLSNSNSSGLWTTDGTSAGTTYLKSVPSVGPAVDLGGTLVFLGSDTTHGWEPWRSDGTPDGTSLVKDVSPGGDKSSLPQSQAAGVQGVGFFTLTTSTYFQPPQVWRTDGTEAGTRPLPSSGSRPYDLTISGGRLFYTASNLAAGGELWMSDGTEAGTHVVADISPGPAGSEPYSLVDAYGTLFFTATEPTTGFELWRSDGSVAGTYRVKDIAPGANDSFPTNMYVADGLLYFAADDGVHGGELWVSDGTEAGTHMVTDLRPGPAWSSPSGMVAVNGVLYFAANDGVAGYELWKLPLTRGPLGARSFYTVEPCRVADTRDPESPWGGPSLSTGMARALRIAGRCGIPPGASAVAGNVTVTNPSAGGHLVAYTAGTVPPLTSFSNFGPGATRANNGTLSLSPEGDLVLRAELNGLPSSVVDVIVDVFGYYR